MKPAYIGSDKLPPWDELDSGIREVVSWLWSLGFQTTDSGDGRKLGEKADMEHVLDVPHVFMVCAPEELVAETRRLAGIVLKIPGWSGRDDANLQGVYMPIHMVGLIELYGLTDELLAGWKP